MPDPQSFSRSFKWRRAAIQILLLTGLISIVFVIIQSCSQTSSNLTRFATGNLERLIVLSPPPAQPEVKFSDTKSERWQLSDFRGKPIILNVWATWCAPCVKEIPSLDALQGKYKDKLGVVTVSMDRDIVEAESFFKSNAINNLQVYHDESLSIASALGVDGLPISVFYSADGVELARISGDVDWESPQIDAFLAQIFP